MKRAASIYFEDAQPLVRYILQNCTLQGLNIALDGAVGSGKTHFVRSLLSAITPDFTDQVASPTFSYCLEYTTDHLIVDHFDLYRVDSAQKLHQIDYFESLESRERLTLVEWAQPFANEWDDFDLKISLSVDDQQKITRFQLNLL